MKRTIIVQTGHAHPSMLEKGLNFDDMFKKIIGSENVETIDVYLGAALPERLDDISHIIITGSIRMVTERLDWMVSTEAWLRRVAQAEIPVLGVCFGHQMLCVAFGGEVDNHPNGTEVGTDIIILNEAGLKDPLFKDLGSEIACYVSHTQSILKRPEGSICLGSSDFEHNHIIKIGKSVYGLQFHPEFTDEINENGISRTEPKFVKRVSQLKLESLKEGLEVGEIILKRFMAL